MELALFTVILQGCFVQISGFEREGGSTKSVLGVTAWLFVWLILRPFPFLAVLGRYLLYFVSTKILLRLCDLQEGKPLT